MGDDVNGCNRCGRHGLKALLPEFGFDPAFLTVFWVHILHSKRKDITLFLPNNDKFSQSGLKCQHSKVTRLIYHKKWKREGFKTHYFLIPYVSANLKYMTETISYSDFEKVHINVGRIIAAEFYAQAKKPAHKLTIDFGPKIGIKKSSAQITEHYQPEDLPGKLVMAVTNFPPRQIGTFISEVLTLGFYDENNAVVLASVDGEVPLGTRMC